MNKLGLVTVLYNSDDVLEGFIRSLSLQTFNQYHLYIIDNSPSAKTEVLINLLTKEYPIIAFSHICNIKNEGIAKANNTGIRLALADGCSHVLLLNNDIEFYQNNLLKDILSASITAKEPIVIPKILFFDSKKIWMAGGRLCKFNAVTYHIGEGKKDSASFNRHTHFAMAPTCFMLIEKSVFAKVGLIDEDYFVYYDDTDFIYRASQAGYQILYLPTLEVHHKVSSSTGGRQSNFSLYYWNKNRILFIKKNLSHIYRFVSLAYIITTTLIKLFIYRTPQRKAMLKGVKDGFASQIN